MGLDELFMKISAEKGSLYADNARKNNRIEKIKEYIKKIVEFISVNLQAEFNRISCSSLGQINTQNIGNSLKKIIEEHIKKAIFLIEKERTTHPNISNVIPDMLIQLNSKINEDQKTKQILKDVFDLNLFHDFGNIIEFFCDLDVQLVDRLLRYLVVLNIHRRISRREILDG